VTDHHLLDVRDAVQRLRDRGLAATVQEVGDRAGAGDGRCAGVGRRAGVDGRARGVGGAQARVFADDRAHPRLQPRLVAAQRVRPAVLRLARRAAEDAGASDTAGSDPVAGGTGGDLAARLAALEDRVAELEARLRVAG
jgi:hypothetical protein